MSSLIAESDGATSESSFTGQFQELELEKKKVRSVKKTFVGPTIKYISTTTPDVSAAKQDDQPSDSASENMAVDE